MDSWKQTLAELSRDRLAFLKRQAFLLCVNDVQAEDAPEPRWSGSRPGETMDW